MNELLLNMVDFTCKLWYLCILASYWIIQQPEEGFYHPPHSSVTGTRGRGRAHPGGRTLGGSDGYQPVRAGASTAPADLLASFLDHYSPEVVDIRKHRTKKQGVRQLFPEERAAERSPRCLRALPGDASHGVVRRRLPGAERAAPDPEAKTARNFIKSRTSRTA